MSEYEIDRLDDEAAQLVYDWYMWWIKTDHAEMPPRHIYVRSADLLARQGVDVPMGPWARSMPTEARERRPGGGP